MSNPISSPLLSPISLRHGNRVSCRVVLDRGSTKNKQHLLFIHWLGAKHRHILYGILPVYVTHLHPFTWFNVLFAYFRIIDMRHRGVARRAHIGMCRITIAYALCTHRRHCQSYPPHTFGYSLPLSPSCPLIFRYNQAIWLWVHPKFIGGTFLNFRRTNYTGEWWWRCWWWWLLL